MSLFLLCHGLSSALRYADKRRGERVSGGSDCISERAGGDEPPELQTGDEHLFWSPADSQHVRSLWQVPLSYTTSIYVWAPQHPSMSELHIVINLRFINRINDLRMAFKSLSVYAVLLRSGPRWCFRARWVWTTLRRGWYGKSMSSFVNQELWTEDLVSSRRITTGLTGSCGLLPSRLKRVYNATTVVLVFLQILGYNLKAF